MAVFYTGTPHFLARLGPIIWEVLLWIKYQLDERCAISPKAWKLTWATGGKLLLVYH